MYHEHLKSGMRAPFSTTYRPVSPHGDIGSDGVRVTRGRRLPPTARPGMTFTVVEGS